MYHARDTTYSIVKDLHGPKHTSTRMLFTESKFDTNWLPLNAKRAAIFGGRPLLENRMFIPRRSGHRARTMIRALLRAFEFGSELENLRHELNPKLLFGAVQAS